MSHPIVYFLLYLLLLCVLLGVVLWIGVVPQRPYPIRRSEMPREYWKFVCLLVVTIVSVTLAGLSYWLLATHTAE